jgi:hypothetical protein
MKIRPVEIEDGCNEANSRVSKFCECAQETKNELVVACSTIRLFSDVIPTIQFSYHELQFRQ